MSYRVPWALDLISVLSILGIYYYIVRYTHARAPGAVNFFSYIVPGLAMVRFQFGLGRTIAAMDREQTSGTLELLLTTPARSWAVVAAASCYELMRSVVMAIAVLALGRWLFGAGLTLGPRSWGALSLGLVGATSFFLALTALTCAVLIAFKQGVPLAGVLALAVPLVSGIYFSPHVLPTFLHRFTDVFPLTLVVQVIRAGVVDATFPQTKVLIMLGATLACLPIAALAVHAAVKRCRRLGTLGQY